MTNGNEPMHPGQTITKYGDPGRDCSGLTKREYFAAQALSGMLATYPTIQQGDNTLAATAVILADRLIDALNIGEAA